jgi:hypothetical protein
MFSVFLYLNRGSSVGLGMGDRGSTPDSGKRILHSTKSKPNIGLTLHPMKRASGSRSSGEKRPEREADYSPLSSSEVDNFVTIRPFVILCLIN